ncbi:GNAT family N-acetyltransferase [Neobacillus sp. D3-1R]|uniref:GNAT family N-acetyltransferase n=1 Tax=Neobacillus sp. D3-1R TaxID=3445778 RepID=UPI003F9FA01F
MEQVKIYIRYLVDSDAEELLKIRLENRNFFQTFEPIRLDSHFTYEEQLREIRKATSDIENDRGYTFGIFLYNTNKLIGRITLSGIVRGPFQNANLGYYLSQDQNGKGYVTEVVGLIVEKAFEELNLHRIQAAVMPKNIPSKRILEKNGFKREGYSQKYLNINGVWEDHEIYALIKED